MDFSDYDICMRADEGIEVFHEPCETVLLFTLGLHADTLVRIIANHSFEGCK